MRRSRRRWIWMAVAAIVAAAMAAAACGGSPAGRRGTGATWGEPGVADPSLAATPPHAAPGEQMMYRLSLYGLEVAAFAISIGEVGVVHGRRAIAVGAGVQSTGVAAMIKKVRTEFASWIDVRTGRPLVSRVVETAGVDDPTIETSEARYHAVADGVLPIAMIAADGTEEVEPQVLAGTQVWDVPSILLYLRGWTAATGAELATQVVRSRYVWRGRFRIAARETVVTELGQVPAVRVEGDARRVLRDGKWEPDGAVRTFSVWISDDADRVPVLIVAHTEYGDVRMEIVDYRAGASPTPSLGLAGKRP